MIKSKKLLSISLVLLPILMNSPIAKAEVGAGKSTGLYNEVGPALNDLESDIQASIKANKEVAELKSLQNLIGDIEEGLTAQPKSKPDDTADQKQAARLALRKGALEKMHQLPLTILKQYKEEIDLLSRYRGDDKMNNDAIDLLAAIASPHKKELPTLKYPNSVHSSFKRTDEKKELALRDIENLNANAEQLKKLKAARNACYLVKQEIDKAGMTLKEQKESEFSKYKTDRAKLVDAISSLDEARREKEFNTLQELGKKQDEKGRAQYNVINKESSDIIPLLIEGKSHGTESSEKMISMAVTDFILKNRKGMVPFEVVTSKSKTTMSSFEDMGKKQDYYGESLEDNKKDDFMFPLTEKGQEAFASMLGIKKSDLTFKKVAANDLRSIDTIWKNTIKHFEAFKNDPANAKMVKEMSDKEEALKALETKHKELVAKLDELAEKVNACQSETFNIDKILLGNKDIDFDSSHTNNKTLDKPELGKALKKHTEDYENLRKSHEATKDSLKNAHGGK
mgnify:CR=1 FL=1